MTTRLWFKPYYLLETIPGTSRFLKVYKKGEGPGLAVELQTHSLWMEEFLILALSLESAQNILYVSIIYRCL